jgi:hypothetical protein
MGKNFMSALRNQDNRNTADLVRDAATGEAGDILSRLNTTPNGLSEAQATERMEEFGPNEVGSGAGEKTRLALADLGGRAQSAGDLAVGAGDRDIRHGGRHK